MKQGVQSSYSRIMDDGNEDELNDSPDVDKRLAMFKKMRQELLMEESKSKE